MCLNIFSIVWFLLSVSLPLQTEQKKSLQWQIQQTLCRFSQVYTRVPGKNSPHTWQIKSSLSFRRVSCFRCTSSLVFPWKSPISKSLSYRVCLKTGIFFLTKLHYYMCIQILLKSQMIYWKQLWFTWDCRLNIIFFSNCLLLEIRKWRQDNDDTYVENWNSIHIYYSQMVLFRGFCHKHTFKSSFC